ncbi:hypothetical protein Q9L58_005549 [Maublancomyces gigas]|uniref:Uncharacterized protein n=1 Tax=Discina gigas TaxID=1032678 RepID=A0ABR3GIV9_9PEZI
MRAPKGSFRDILIYENGHPDPRYYRWEKTTRSSEGYGRYYGNLVAWTRARFPFVEDTEFKKSGQIIEPNDYMAYTSHQTGPSKHVYINTGDSRNGFTHDITAGKLVRLDQGCRRSVGDALQPKKRSARTSTKISITRVRGIVLGHPVRI